MTKVVVAMSGGVDSSVAAALLKKGGFDTTGVFMKLADLPSFGKAEKRARKIAKILKIPLLVLDLRREFKKRIVDYFLDGYKKGITPNPCVVCNKEIKFGLLLEKALKLDAKYVATGHYARKSELTTNNLQLTTYRLLKAKDKNKDQSYFLWMLNQEQLKRILFPVGDYTRKEVENLARKFKLPVLKARKSVEICFIQTTIHPVKSRKAGVPLKAGQFNRVNDFLKKCLKSNPGKIICLTPGVKQKEIGKHRGLWFYTIGQRKGIGLPGGPYYVLNKDLRKNLLIATKNEKDLLKKELVAKNVNWVSGKKPKLPLKIKAKIRYRHKATTAIISRHLKYAPYRNEVSGAGSKVYRLKFKVAQRAITPGQSIVFYKAQELLGGGIIC